MDERLVTWGRRVKSCLQASGRWRRDVPVLWLFSDPVRLPDPIPAARRLPVGLCGVVLRFDGPAAGAEERQARRQSGRALASLCRQRRLALQVAGDPWLARQVGAGIHLRRGRCIVGPRVRRLLTSSAHGVAELRRAACAGVDAVFLSPCFATASHPGLKPLSPRRWLALSRTVSIPVFALGGVTGASARALSYPACVGAGAIEALSMISVG